MREKVIDLQALSEGASETIFGRNKKKGLYPLMMGTDFSFSFLRPGRTVNKQIFCIFSPSVIVMQLSTPSSQVMDP